MKHTVLKTHKTFEGKTLFCEHDSVSTKTKMKFSVYLPKEIGEIENCLIWLSGLTCNEENFITKAGAQKFLAGTKTMVICPDTSPRGLDLPNEHDSYDFGSGAGFYVNATTDGYRDHYKMYDYITKDLITLLREDFKVKKFSIFGHSMGGHGALVIGLREKDLFKSVSAFSPIVNPVSCPWGQKALKGYLGDNNEEWKKYDAVELLKSGKTRNAILIDQGIGDEFLEKELLTSHFVNASKEVGQDSIVNMREGYDHSYYFIQTFVEDHIKFHLQHFS